MSAAWFPDPNDPTRLRYWDGERWTEHTAPLPAAAPAATPPAAAPGILAPPPMSAQADLESERAGGRRAGLAQLVGVVLVVAYDALALLMLRDLVPWMRDSLRLIFDAAESGSSAPPPLPEMPRGLEVTQGFTQLLWLALIVVRILFAIWVYRAALLARRAGLPATHSPGWTVAGFFVPVISLWFPYQGLRDLFPPGNPARRTARLWFTAYLAHLVLGTVGVGIAFVALPAGAVVVALGTVAGVAQMLLGRAVIKQSLEAHAQLVGSA
ncbi:DUF2510 domain-containing protein [Spongisporangium articulatum]|uniref:DUF2510 domain-containing protein n=1 Tax=Spongisporangium articulatum TaxID=3362603 RepID=A0ABW8APS0_9ACTN